MRKRLLVVDDEPLILFSLSAALQSESMIITTASSGTEALQSCEQEADFDLYMVDLTLPDMDGFALIGAIRRKQPQVPVIIMSGKFRDKKNVLDQVGECESIEPFEFMGKPFDIDETRELVFQFLYM